VLHRVTPVTLAAPTWLGRLGLPTVIGPLNSGLTDPRGFGVIMKQESTWLIKVRVLGHLLDAALGSSRGAARILTARRTTQRSVASRPPARCRMMLENGVELSRFTATPWPALPAADQPLRVLFVGRLIPIKGVDMLLHALARLRDGNAFVCLDIVGDGPMREAWMTLRDELGLGDRVSFHGALPLDAVAVRMRDCHVFCLPSVRESGGAVLLEAMACARPVIALDFGGPGEIVSAEVGALLPLTNPEQVIDGLALTLNDVLRQPQAWQRRGLAGRRLVEERYSWPAKIAAAEDTYREILVERALSCC
jgi:glycosyltransferase involved in cell wall biosynthesis